MIIMYLYNLFDFFIIILVYSSEKSPKKVCLKQKRREFIEKLTHELSEVSFILYDLKRIS